MNKNTVEGTLKQAKGSVKEALGKVTGDEQLQAEGATEKVAGHVQEGVGKAQDAVEDVADKLSK